MAGSLPRALGKLGMDVRVFIPKYRGITVSRKKISPTVTAHFIENDTYFNRPGLYGDEQGDYPDNLERFAYFCRRSLELARELDFRPDLIHINDWQTALVPVYLKQLYSNDPFFRKTKTLLTIHNLAYQGHFPARSFSQLGLDQSLFSIQGFEFHGKINLLKAGLIFSDAISTVSPSYAREIETQEHGWGLEGVIHSRRQALRGILNGIDKTVWNPVKDKLIAKNYSATAPAGKAACKAALQRECGLKVDPEIPVFGMVSRLAQQKGIDLLIEIAETFLLWNAQLLLLGDGDSHYKRKLAGIFQKHPGKAVTRFDFDVELAHRIYAGSDFFLMPSLFEPCGLGQLISLAYGTLPIVRRTGGLADTIVDMSQGARGNGLVFEKPQTQELLEVMDRAITLFADEKRFKNLRKTAMKLDFSWEHSAKDYRDYYLKIIKGAVK